MPQHDAGVGITLRGGEELRKISAELRTLGNGREVRKRFTKELRTAARPMVPAVRASIMAIPSDGGHSSGLRKRMARATRLRVNTVGKNASIAVLVDGKRMPPGERSLPAYMEATRFPWRHPVYGNTNTWVRQKAHPYFYRVVIPLGRRSRSAVNRVLDQITRDIS